jgi:hypothetical protein
MIGRVHGDGWKTVIVNTCVDPFSSGCQPLRGDQRGVAHGSVSLSRVNRGGMTHRGSGISGTTERDRVTVMFDPARLVIG